MIGVGTGLLPPIFHISIIGELCPQFTNIARRHVYPWTMDVSQGHKLGDRVDG